MTELRIATRASRLAIDQARLVGDRLRAVDPELTIRLVEVSTVGDRDRVSDVAALTEMGAFVRAVQFAVLDGDADIAVHSCKDLPVAGPEGLVQWFPDRASPFDVLCGGRLADLDQGARVGTGSPRRTEQLLEARPDLTVVPIRGNVDTRLGLIGETVDAVVLAEAGLQRLGLEADISERFDADTMTPAPAQGALCVETPIDSPFVEALGAIDDADVRTVVGAERLLLERTGAGCRSALGGFAVAADDRLEMTGFVSDDRGRRRARVQAGDAHAVVASLCSELGL